MSIPITTINLSTEICKYESPDYELNIYPYDNLNWLNYVERFKFKVPDIIVTTADGESICRDCNQKYAGRQDRCVRSRYGYHFSSYNRATIHFGHKLVGEDGGKYDGKVVQSGLFPCNDYCTWNKSDEFYEQNRIFSEFKLVIDKMCSTYVSGNLEMNQNDAEKWNLIQQIDLLKMENERLIHAIKEIANRLNAGGSGLLGQLNF